MFYCMFAIVRLIGERIELAPTDSGHSGQVESPNTEEDDGMDECK